MIKRDYDVFMGAIQHWYNVYDCYRYQAPLEQVNTNMVDFGLHDGALHLQYQGDSPEMAQSFKDAQTYKKECLEAETFVKNFANGVRVSRVDNPKITYAMILAVALQAKINEPHTLPTLWLYHSTCHGYIFDDDFSYLAPLGIKPLLGVMLKDNLLLESDVENIVTPIQQERWDDAMAVVFDYVHGSAVHISTAPAL